MTITANLSARLESLLGSERVLSSESDSRIYAIEDCIPAAVVKPANAQEVAEVVRFAAAENLALVCCGSRSKLNMGLPPRRYDVAVDLTALTEIVHYDPEDLTLSVDAGLPLASLADVLAARGQFLPLSVPFFKTSTVGGSVASGIDSMLRLQYGASRDFLIGAEFVDGKGHLCKSGGRVVKNVTGYDIHKLLIGSLGTLAAITRLNFRTFPLPETSAGHLAGFSTPETALAFRKSVLASGLPFSGVQLFDPGFAELLSGKLREGNRPAAELLDPPRWFVYAFFSGHGAVVRRLRDESNDLASKAGAALSEILDQPSNEFFTEALREAFAWLQPSAPNVAIFRLAQQHFTPADVAQLQQAPPASPLKTPLLLNASGICLLALLSAGGTQNDRESLERRVREVFSFANANASGTTLPHAPAWLKSRLDVWGSTPPGFPLMQRVKSAFDPQNIFSPGRFVGGL